MKLAIITCYNQPDYVRAKTLRAAAETIDDVEVVVIKNMRTGLLRYFEVLYKLIKARLAENPDVYLLTFRGYEMLLPVRLISLGKRMIYDEFVNPIEWVVLEQRQVEAKQKSNRLYAQLVSLMSRIIVAVVSSWLFKQVYRSLVSSVDLILSDTDSHARVSEKILGMNEGKVEGVLVGTDEATFAPQQADSTSVNDIFTVLYYGNMLPLHGLNYVIDAAVQMANDSIKFILVGGNAKVARDVARAIKDGANIEYHSWVEFVKLPELMRKADVCIAGPFGNTFQSQYVITGKTYQYMALGRPTLIGINEEAHNFTDGKNALTVPQANADAITAKLRWAMVHRSELPKIGKAGRKLYDDKFAVPVLAVHLKKILTRVVG